jgi:hypothetical protein
MKKLFYTLLFFYGASLFAQIPTLGQVGYYHFESSGFDSSPNINHLVAGINNSSITYPVGFSGNGIDLSTVSSCDYLVKTSFSGLSNGAFSISTWMKLTSNNSGVPNVLFLGKDPLSNNTFSIEEFNTFTSIYTFHGGGTYTVANIDSSGLGDGWNNLTFVFDIDSIYIYTNGIKVMSTSNFYGVLVGNTNHIQVGNAYPYCLEFVTLDESIIYNRALTSSEVLDIFNAPTLGNEIFESPDATHIYPNPVSNLLHIDWKGQTPMDKIELLSIDGKIVETYNTATTFINVEKLIPGVYFISITSGNRAYISKFIKN